MPEQTATTRKQFTITRVFDAPRDLVWQAWTTEADAAEWWHPRGIEIKPGSVSVDARVGGRYAYTMVNPADGQEYPTAGVYREVSPPERLVYTWGSPGDPDDEAPVITVELRELPEDRTEMRFHLVGFEGAPGDDNVYDGWDSAFDMLEEQLAGGNRLMGTLVVEQIVSVDGYAADADGGLGFIDSARGGDPNDHHQLAFLADVDAILLGANTYRMFAGYWPTADPEVEVVAEPINRLPKFVMSNSIESAPWGEGAIEILRGHAAEAVAGLKARHSRIVVWGSLTLADSLFEAGLVDELRLRVVPVLIGEGRSFTPAKLGERRLELDHVVTHPSGHVGMEYRVR